MAISLLLQSFNFMGDESNGYFAIFNIGLYLIFFSFGMGPGAWLIPSEVFSTSVRARAMSLATFSNRLVATIFASSFLSMAHALTWAGFFLLLAVICIFVGIFFYFLVPETKGRSLEDMSLYFAEITNDRSVLDAHDGSGANSAVMSSNNSGGSSHSGLEMQPQHAGTMT